MARIVSIGTALPRHRYPQAAIKRAYAGIFAGHERLKRYLPIFDRAGVRARHLAKPLPYYVNARGFAERNRDYMDAAEDLSMRALRQCLRGARARRELGHLVFVTTTGLATPSMDARIAGRMGLGSGLKRTPIFGTGCASGAVALARAADYLKADPAGKAAVVSAELCSLTMRTSDASVENLVACALFADGAAAVLLEGSRGSSPGPRILASASHLFPDSLKVMGWDFQDEGMKLVLSPAVPRLVRSSLRPLIEGFLNENGARLADVRHWLLHPGGLKVIEAYEQAFGLSPRQTRWSRRCLAQRGNMSSASVLFMLDDLMRNGRPRTGDIGLMAALGPGFAAEMLLLQW